MTQHIYIYVIYIDTERERYIVDLCIQLINILDIIDNCEIIFIVPRNNKIINYNLIYMHTPELSCIHIRVVCLLINTAINSCV